MSRLEEYRYLLERSKRFYETAVMQIDKGFYDLAAFSLEQSLQLFLEACLLKLGIDYPRTHSVRKLLDIMLKVTGKKEVEDILNRFSLELGALEDAYITSRYVAREDTLEEVKRLRKAVDEVIELVRRLNC
jgi:HEPN domain-containing protein